LFNEENNRELNIPQEHENYTKDVILDTLKQQQSVNNKLLEMLDHYKNALKISERRRQTEQEQTSKQLKELEERLAERISQQINNRDKEMMDYIRQSQRQNQQQLLDIVAIKEKKQQKSFFTRLFGK
jgi:predicted RNA-binding protein with RPS1 domain